MNTSLKFGTRLKGTVIVIDTQFLIERFPLNIYSLQI